MNHKRACEVFGRWGEADSAEKEEALSHAAACKECQGNFEGLVGALSGVNPIPCAECRNRLPPYVVISTWARAKSVWWFEVSQHLHTCPECLKKCMELEVYIEKIRKEKMRKKEKKGSRK